MREKIALIISTGEDDVSFYREEVLDVKRTPLRYNRVQPLPGALPSVEYEGDNWSLLEIHIRLAYGDTLERIRAVRGMSGTVTVFYAMAEDPLLSLTGLVHPDCEEKRYLNAKTEHLLSILECA